MKRDGRGIEAIPCNVPFHGAGMGQTRQRADGSAFAESDLLDLMHPVRSEVACHTVSLTHSISSER